MLINENIDSKVLLHAFHNLYDVAYCVDMVNQDTVLLFVPKKMKEFLPDQPRYQDCIDVVEKNIEPLSCESFLTFMRFETIASRLKGKHVISFEFETKHLGWIRIAIIPAEIDSNGVLHKVVVCLRSIKEEMAWRNELIRLANTDAMTGLLNHHSATNYIQEALDLGKSGVLMLMDCDKFKLFNDRCGHIVGDKVIIALASHLKKEFPTSLVYRMGGDEFGVFMEGIYTEAELQQLMKGFFDRIDTLSDDLVEIQEKQLELVISVGAVQHVGPHSCAYKDLFAKVDKCLYESKKFKKNHLTYLEKC